MFEDVETACGPWMLLFPIETARPSTDDVPAKGVASLFFTNKQTPLKRTGSCGKMGHHQLASKSPSQTTNEGKLKARPFRLPWKLASHGEPNGHHSKGAGGVGYSWPRARYIIIYLIELVLRICVQRWELSAQVLSMRRVGRSTFLSFCRPKTQAASAQVLLQLSNK